MEVMLLFLYFIVYPFGQLAKVGPFLLIDAILALFLVILLIKKHSYPKFWRHILVFCLITIFSLVYSVYLFESTEAFKGVFYLLRLLGNLGFLIVVYNFVKDKEESKTLLLNSLIVVSLFIGIFGWLQYFIYPDLRSFTAWGWDDHLYRLVGTFLDPGFTSILLVFGFLAVAFNFSKTKQKHFLVFSAFLLMSVLFTYARAGYLALLVGSFVLFRKKLQYFLVILTIALGIINLLPKPAGEGVKLERTSTVLTRVQSYKETFEIIKSSPLLGIGFNNICLARQNILKDSDVTSHSCSGSDSSLLLVLATTGVLGFSVFLRILGNIVTIEKNQYEPLLLSTGAALLTHSLFVNSMFYPWVMGWVVVLLAISIKEYSQPL